MVIVTKIIVISAITVFSRAILAKSSSNVHVKLLLLIL